MNAQKKLFNGFSNTLKWYKPKKKNPRRLLEFLSILPNPNKPEKIHWRTQIR
jgi:hypothetical protein